MPKFIVFLCVLCTCSTLLGQSKTEVPTIYIDGGGVMRWSDTKAEASFYGVNYTVPFAHAYRALHYKGIDHKAAIDRDVYHLARLGFNAYRIHIWDVEISDAKGNLITNEHLDLLDYLFSKLEERGIRILVTAMTNFGNGYPERNQLTGAFSYLYDKCSVHADPQAIEAQKRYMSQLVNHINPYTGKAYKDDPYVVGFEINNEPCHTGEATVTRKYINEMLSALKKAGNRKPVFYNVSHNMEHVPAYYQSAVQGTTYQWYPVGLVAGRERKGNFLPYVANYSIPFVDEKGFTSKAKAVYEYDPADVLYGYIHPAMSRTFRSSGFQWITQFAYDPLDIAAYNTEYQTHYLNLAYTPAKAISTMIAAEVAYQVPRNQQFGTYPLDTLFGDFMVSYKQDLSLMNAKDKYYYSNHTAVEPVSPNDLQHIAGHGSSPLVQYAGSGAFFLDKLREGVWRLEVMPDAEQVADPFSKPSLSREVVRILWQEWPMTIDIPDLGDGYQIKRLAPDTVISDYRIAKDKSVIIVPGVYILSRNGQRIGEEWTANTLWDNFRLGEFVAPSPSDEQQPYVCHTPPRIVERGSPLALRMKVVSRVKPDSVMIQTDKVSFWRNDNPSIKMEQQAGYSYTAVLPAELLASDKLKYTVTVYAEGRRFTYPQAAEGAPLDWDFSVSNYFTITCVDPTSSVLLVTTDGEESAYEHYAIPETSYLQYKKTQTDLTKSAVWDYNFVSRDSASRFFWQKDISRDITARRSGIAQSRELCLAIAGRGLAGGLEVGFVSDMGYTYVANVTVDDKKEGIQVVRIPLNTLKQVPTALLPAPYPVFLERYFVPQINIPFQVTQAEKLLISTRGSVSSTAELHMGSVWLE
jgi:hypothetical protein